MIYDDHVKFVWRVLGRLGVARADLEDVCQEVFIVVHRRLAEFEGRSTLRTWIYGIALRCASDYRRRDARRRPASSAVPEIAIEGSQLEDLDARDARATLDRLLELLDPDKREVFVLFELEELAMAEVVALVGCPLQTGYSRLHAAREIVAAAAARMRAKERRS
ncbi:MAG TPA: sigma-70 family RNA polymerase sigma factor [Kofleriaceae bacterium]|nr:sigma-70 family RNA polymerase sigma factor [Kofleriaceae bacterium]